MAAAEFALSSSNAANVFLAFTPTNGFLNAGTATELLLAVAGCSAGPILAGNILSLINAPGQTDADSARRRREYPMPTRVRAR